jgi:hypothetical protein
MTEQWTTRVQPEWTRPFGVEEAHNVWFTPKGWTGKGTTLCLLIPQCELQFCEIDCNGDPLVIINRPQINKNVKSWLRYACSWARDAKYCLIIACDTAEQAARAAKLGTKLLPRHERAALERFADPGARARGNLN